MAPTPAYANVEVAQAAGVATVTLHRPDAVNMGVKRDLPKVVAALADVRDVRCVVFPEMAGLEAFGQAALYPTWDHHAARRGLAQKATPSFSGR